MTAVLVAVALSWVTAAVPVLIGIVVTLIGRFR